MQIVSASLLKRLFGFALLCIALSNLSFTQQIRYVPVASGVGTLDAAIAGDSSGRKANPNTVYLLERDGYYITQSTISNSGYHLMIEAAKGTGAKPIVRPGVLPGGTTSSRCFNPKGDFTLKGVYLLNMDDAPLPKVITNGIRIGASGLRITIDSCQIDYDGQSTIRLDNGGCKIFLRNSIFSNLGDMNGANGRVVDTRGNAQDTIVYENCIIYNVAEKILRTDKARVNYIMMNHNTFVNCPVGEIAFGSSLDINYQNNLMVNCGIIGNYTNDTGNLIFVDTLTSAGTQKVNIHHNNYYLDTAISNKYATIKPPLSILPVSQTPLFDSLCTWWMNKLNTTATNTLIKVAFTKGPQVPLTQMIAQHDTSIHFPYKPELDKGTGVSIEYGQPHYVFNLSYPTSSPLYNAGSDGKPLGSLLDWKILLSVEGNRITSEMPAGFRLFDNYPNPFNPSTTIKYSVPEQSNVDLSVYNAIGQKVITLISGEVKPGVYEVTWHGRTESGKPAASGLYLCRFSTSKFVKISKMMLLK